MRSGGWGSGHDEPVNPSTALARVLIDELVRHGVTEVVLAPGSRNAPLSMALHDADARGRLRLHVRIDERTAGFLAVGLARGSGRPAAVVTTSGTAVANLHPAVLEAHHGGVPLVVLSADRPPALRDVGANQTIDQRVVFTGALRFFHEFDVARAAADQQAGWRAVTSRAVLLAADAGRAGPVQLNVPLAEPLLPDDPDGGAADEAGAWPESLAGRPGPWTTGPAVEGVPAAVPPVEPGERVLFVGDLTHPAAGRVAAAGHLVVSEAGGAAGADVLAAGMHLVASSALLDAAGPDRVVVLGRPTLFRAVTGLLRRPGLVVDVVCDVGAYSDPAGLVRSVAPGLPALVPPPEDWAERWRRADRLAGTAVAGALDRLDVAASPRLARDLVAALPPGGTLVLGSSQPPRDVGLTAGARDGVRLVANRGVAGIDGTVSTAVGVALARDDSPTVAFLGDLTFLHDATGLVIGPHEPRPDLTIVVSNNDGGAIFSTLEPGEARHASAFERVFGTPHGVQLAGWADAVGVEHELVVTAEQLTEAISHPGGLRILEVPTSRSELAGQLRDLRAAALAALE